MKLVQDFRFKILASLSIGDNNSGQHVLLSCSPWFARIFLFLMWCLNYHMGMCRTWIPVERKREREIYIIIVIICNLYTVCTYTRLFKTCLMVLCIIAMFFNT